MPLRTKENSIHITWDNEGMEYVPINVFSDECYIHIYLCLIILYSRLNPLNSHRAVQHMARNF